MMLLYYVIMCTPTSRGNTCTKCEVAAQLTLQEVMPSSNEHEVYPSLLVDLISPRIAVVPSWSQVGDSVCRGSDPHVILINAHFDPHLLLSQQTNCPAPDRIVFSVLVFSKKS